MTSSRKTMCTGRSRSGQPGKNTGSIDSPAMGTWTAKMNATAFLMLSKMRRPRRTAATIDEKSSSSSTSAAASRATSVPRPPMAMPMWAALRAGASLTPSPVMATTSRLALSAFTIRSFCSGTTRAKTSTPPMRAARSSSDIAIQLGAGDDAPPVRKPRLPGDALRGGRIVAGDHDHANPRRLALRHCRRDRRSQRVLETDQSRELERQATMLVLQIRLASPPVRDAENAQALGRERRDLRGQRPSPLVGHVAELGDRLGRALGGYGEVVLAFVSPHLAHAKKVGAERVLPHHRPVGMKARRLREQTLSGLVEGSLHRVERIALAGQYRVLEQRPSGRGKVPRCRRQIDRLADAAHHPSERHLVGGQGAGLVDAQHRRGAQRLDRRHAPGEHAAARDPPGAQGEEDGEDDGELLGQRGHGQRDAGQEPLLPHGGAATSREAVGHDHQRARRQAHDRARADQARPSPAAAGSPRARSAEAPCRSSPAPCGSPWRRPRRFPGPP